MSDGLQAGLVQPSQPALVGNLLDVGQPLLENGQTTTPANVEPTQRDDVERYASPVNISALPESDSNFLAQSDIQTTPVQFPIFGDTEVASMSAESESSNSAQSDIHTTPVQFPIINDTDFEVRAVGRSTNSSVHTEPEETGALHQTSRSSTPFPSEPFPMQQNTTNTSPISRISPFLFPVFSGQDGAPPWTPPLTTKPSNTTVAPKKRKRQVHPKKVNDTKVPSSRGPGGGVAPNAQSNNKFKITEAFLSNGKYFIKVPGNNQLIPFAFDARFGIPKHIKIHEMNSAV